MSDDFLKSTDPTIYISNVRKAIGTVQAASMLWMNAFDSGDIDALDEIDKIFNKSMSDVVDAKNAIVSFYEANYEQRNEV